MKCSYQLLEKTRLCMDANTAGSNFNVFYSLSLNAPTTMKDILGLTDSNFVVCFFGFFSYFI